ncbi:MAG TPA: SRPBCC domain-containing protein [Bacteroidales bacterium]|nr:SRPBCC domain-containing protein [Bacteroidales bacterium]
METMKLTIETAIQVQKPVSVVYEAIVNPEKMSHYFISESTGRMEEGREITWKFPEFEIRFPVKVGSLRKDEYVSFYWDTENGKTLVGITLASGENNSTVVTITEKEADINDAGLRWLAGNTQGWANFLACLKAYLEYGINLRKGAFDFMKDRFKK